MFWTIVGAILFVFIGIPLIINGTVLIFTGGLVATATLLQALGWLLELPGRVISSLANHKNGQTLYTVLGVFGLMIFFFTGFGLLVAAGG